MSRKLEGAWLPQGVTILAGVRWSQTFLKGPAHYALPVGSKFRATVDWLWTTQMHGPGEWQLKSSPCSVHQARRSGVGWAHRERAVFPHSPKAAECASREQVVLSDPGAAAGRASWRR